MSLKRDCGQPAAPPARRQPAPRKGAKQSLACSMKPAPAELARLFFV
jgi:hypothetical protein